MTDDDALTSLDYAAGRVLFHAYYGAVVCDWHGLSHMGKAQWARAARDFLRLQAEGKIRIGGQEFPNSEDQT